MAAHLRKLKNAPQRLRVVIAGGGVAALETLLALRSLAGHRVEVTLLSPNREFVYRPVTVAEAFDRGEARVYSLAEIAGERDGDELVWDSLERVEAEAQTVVTGLGERLPYDVLVLATGASFLEPLEGALTFRGRGDVAALRQVLEDLLDGSARSVAFALPTERMWPLPLYELALMTGATLRERGSSARVMLVTPEAEPLELFGPAAGEAIAALFEDRQIEIRRSARPARIRGRALMLAGGGTVFADRVVTLPLTDGPRIPGVPHDEHGFIRVDAHGRVIGMNCVYAAGDATAFPLKQGGLAAQQADAVAQSIAAELGLPVRAQPVQPVLRGLLLTGASPLYLRAEPQHLEWQSTVAIDATPARRVRNGAASVTGQALWWPPAKIAGRYLAPYLATTHAHPLAAQMLTDRHAVPGPALAEEESEEALELALLLAELDARWGDYGLAINALDAAQGLAGTLPPEYEEKRRRWAAAERFEGP